MSRRESCTPLSALWCPNHGRCSCPDPENAKDDMDCPLHAPGSDHAQDCPDAKHHTAIPRNYLAWPDWAERKAKTHRQIRCETCGFWAIWVPKAKP